MGKVECKEIPFCATAVLTIHQKEADDVCMQVAIAATASRDKPEKPSQKQQAARGPEIAQKPVRQLRGGSATAQEGGVRAKTARSQDLPRQQPSAAAELEQDSPRPSSLPTKGQKVLTCLDPDVFIVCMQKFPHLSVTLHNLHLGVVLLMTRCIGRDCPMAPALHE